ncbi:methyltransferase domain-containing protein [Thermodesulfobacterium hydrogeniphilum]|uniref:methyltransferase domain-containing protein n=1 Tax=Thermodesulfobacterium hydrogeniphilum TaxID=161156 RepID=UPI00068D65F4|nr:methyltransferase domain-containing protein [Thermodesulfobacterium hydrogeniphilum]
MAHLTRYYMDKRIKGCFNEVINRKILGISGIEDFRSLIGKNAEVLDVRYPEVDIQSYHMKIISFDFVINDQIIKHLKNPKKTIEESYWILKKGGIAIHTTCFINYIHYCPKGYWRFSPDALRYLCKDFSEILQCEGWENRIAILLCFISNKFRFMKIPETKWSIRRLIITYNEKKYPIVTWVVVKK